MPLGLRFTDDNTIRAFDENGNLAWVAGVDQYDLPTLSFTDVLPREEWVIDESFDAIVPAGFAESADTDPLDLAELYDDWDRKEN